MLTSTFSFSINNPVEERCAVIARLDGKHPSLISASCGGKIVIYTPSSFEEKLQ